MIVPLKKVTVVCVDAAREQTLEALRDMGVLHLVHLQEPSGLALDTVRKQVLHVQRALDALPPSAAVTSASESENPVEEIHQVLSLQKKTEETLSHLKAELARFSAFGAFDPAQIQQLSRYNVYVKLYECDESAYQLPEGECSVNVFQKKNGLISFALISREPLEVKATEIRLPEKSIAALQREYSECVQTLEQCQQRLAALSSRRGLVQRDLENAEDAFTMEKAGAGMLQSGGVSLIQGYSSDESIAEIRRIAPQMGWGIRIDTPEEEEDVPTLLKHPKWVKPIETLYNVIGITPGYREIDTSAVFLLFFSIFFAMIVGDAGYGLLFLGATFWASKKFTQAPREIFQFLGIMSVSTILWGTINASFFGISSSVLPAFADLARAGYTPEPLRRAVNWIRDEDNLKFFCFVLGVTHLTIAHLWNAWVNRRSSVAIAQIGWLCTTWAMFFLAGTMVIGKPFPSQVLYLGIGGAVLILLFSVPPSRLKDGWFDLVMLPLNLVSNFVDVISYIRLFAVGMAGFAVANSFNEMMAPLFGSIPGALLAAVVLFLAHSLNIVLAAMGVAVHAVRLNTLEFSNHVGLQWSGSVFTPFSRHKN